MSLWINNQINNAKRDDYVISRNNKLNMFQSQINDVSK